MDIKALQPFRPEVIRGTEAAQAQAKNAKTPEDIKKAATQFEGLLVQQMLKSMWATVPTQEGSITGSREEQMYRDMLQEAMATNIAEHSSLGIAAVIEKDMKQIEARSGHGASKPVADTLSDGKKG
jgi:flagellar protein FlgJ